MVLGMLWQVAIKSGRDNLMKQESSQMTMGKHCILNHFEQYREIDEDKEWVMKLNYISSEKTG